jgi:hypothetical protein
MGHAGHLLIAAVAAAAEEEREILFPLAIAQC